MYVQMISFLCFLTDFRIVENYYLNQKELILGLSMSTTKITIFQKTMKKFFQTNYSIQYYLERLSKLIAELEEDLPIFYAYFQKTPNSINLFKLLILLHYCVITNVEVENEKVLEVLKNTKMKSHGMFEKYL